LQHPYAALTKLCLKIVIFQNKVIIFIAIFPLHSRSYSKYCISWPKASTEKFPGGGNGKNKTEK